ncbi:PKD domain protein [Planctomycetes bacterium Pla86]|uniref:PKD domain protein n=2 Tax=Engelhardtia mirabilis TaxID=2528011 RepID=A0A518BLC7_9BACT|nr:PKD domain protein [Planctomycetes bacterium Pla133]QDV02105.1 PKD domain protein [Planctomycetes bacterium Pla86]
MASLAVPNSGSASPSVPRPTASPTPAPISPPLLSADGGDHALQASLPAHFELTAVVTGLDYPTALATADDGTLLIASKSGLVYAYRNGTLQDTTLIDLSLEVLSVGDRGLLGLAVHPDWVPDGGATSWAYLSYTASGVFGEEIGHDEDGHYSHGMLTRYRVITGPDERLAFDPASRQVLLGLRLPDGSAPDALASLHDSHSSGALRFAPDGTLLLSQGDGAHWNFDDFGSNDPEGFDDFVHPVTGLRGQLPLEQDSGAFRARDPRSLAGKLLRLDPETGYGLPSNPHWNGNPASNPSRVYASGLRNPYRFTLRPGTGSSDPADGDVGQVFIGDVGHTDFEELNVVVQAGVDFGWPVFEGTASNSPYDVFVRPGQNPLGLPDSNSPAPGPVVAPALTWSHSSLASLQPDGVHLDQAGNPGGGFIGACVILGDFYVGPDYPSQYQGELFFSDYGADWLRSARFDAAGNLSLVRDFGAGLGNVVDLRHDPLTGEVLLLELGLAPFQGRVLRLRYGANLSPVASLAADVNSGDSPLDVVFDASASSDPEGDPLSFEFDFGDGSPKVVQSGPTIAHQFTSDGFYLASVEVSDDGGLVSKAQVSIVAGSSAPVVWISSPAVGSAPSGDTALALVGGGQDPSGGDLTFDWRIDLYHDDHVHPAFWTDSQVDPSSTSTSYAIVPHAADGDLYYYRVVLTGTTGSGASASADVWSIPAGQALDPVGTGVPISRVDELTPPQPLGLGNADVEVIRDGVSPAVGSTELELQFDTEHNGDQGDDDWIGVSLAAAPVSQSRFVSLTFREGAHSAAGGWFEDPAVEVRVGTEWVPVQDLSCEPPYPGGTDPGPGFEQYVFHFTPTWGEAIRLRGKPGGSLGFVSCSELHAQLLSPEAALPQHLNLAQAGTIISSLDALSPPLPLGSGNPNPETIRNGTLPVSGSTSLHAQFDTSHNGDQGPLDWIGYAFDPPRTLERVVFQEGLEQPTGGWLDTLVVETRLDAAAPWTAVPGMTIDPPYRGAGPGTPSYESWSVDFPPLLVREVRVAGQPGGSGGFLSVGELEALGPWWDAGKCGFTTYGTEFTWNTLVLDSATPPLLGYPGLITLSGADPGMPGGLMVAIAPLSVPIGPFFLLVDPTVSFVSPFLTDPDGELDWIYALPSDVALSGATLFLQSAVKSLLIPGGLRWSHGLEMSICE